MAAIVDRPVSMHPNIPTLIPERRRRDSVEVIDVDSLDDDEIRASQRPLQRRRLDAPELISLLDSDDEHEQPVASGSGIHRARGHRLTSLPPPPQDATIPPVPTVPRRFSALQSFPPMRRRPPPFPTATGVVRPNPQPFPFEANIRTATPANNPATGPPPAAAAPPSHHRPLMGLGGALISLNRANEAHALHERLNRDRPRPRSLAHSRSSTSLSRAHSNITNVMRRISDSINFNFNALPSEDDVDIDDETLALHLLLDDAENFDGHAGFHPARAFARREMMLRTIGRDHSRADIEYKPSYTHPRQPDSGFTFDFAPPSPPSPKTQSPFPSTSSDNPIVILDDDTPVASGSQSKEPPANVGLSIMLVCARCLDPLVLGGGIAPGGPEEEKKRKVWGLRCGHVLDGKCLEEISTPAVLPPPVDVKGKGKARALDYEQDEGQEEDDEPDYDSMDMRYPLRSRVARPQIKRKGKTAVKSKAKAKTKVEAEHQWMCPVAGCEKMHVSIKVNGVWGADRGGGGAASEGRGAISIFV